MWEKKMWCKSFLMTAWFASHVLTYSLFTLFYNQIWAICVCNQRFDLSLALCELHSFFFFYVTFQSSGRPMAPTHLCAHELQQ